MSKSSKKMLLISSNYWPESTGIGVYSTDLAENAFSQFYDVTVLTGLPHYPWWKIPDQFQDMIPGNYTKNNVRLIRVQHAIPKSAGAIGRARLEFSFWRNMRKVLRKNPEQEFDCIVAIMPTVASGLVTRQFATKRNLHFYMVFQDISSAGARESGMPGARWLSKIGYLLEKRAIRGATGVAIVSDAMRETITNLANAKTPITLLPNYSIHEASNISKQEARAYFRLSANEFIFLHSGNIGHKQDLLNLVEASRLIQNASVRIYIVGHGNQENVIRDAIADQENVTWLPSVPMEDYKYLLASADVLLVNERSTQLSMSLPSKITSYLSSNRPILAAVPEGGATAVYLATVARLVPSGNPEKLAEAIDAFVSDPKIGAELASKGLQLFHSDFSKERAYSKYLEWISQ